VCFTEAMLPGTGWALLVISGPGCVCLLLLLSRGQRTLLWCCMCRTPSHEPCMAADTAVSPAIRAPQPQLMAVLLPCACITQQQARAALQAAAARPAAGCATEGHKPRIMLHHVLSPIVITGTSPGLTARGAASICCCWCCCCCWWCCCRRLPQGAGTCCSTSTLVSNCRYGAERSRCCVEQGSADACRKRMGALLQASA
jgi:hypothetical protein